MGNPGKLWINRLKPCVSLALLAMLLGSADPAHTEDGALASAAVDYSLYRDGEVKRLTNTFGVWNVVCDEIKRLHQRFCSLKSAFKDADDHTLAEITVSTGDNGRPAALVRTTLGLYLGRGVRLWVEAPQTAKAKTKPKTVEHQLDLIACDTAGCLAIWSILPAEIEALNAGASVHVRLTRLSSLGLLTPSIAAPDRMMAVEAVTGGTGFAQAVASTLK